MTLTLEAERPAAEAVYHEGPSDSNRGKAHSVLMRFDCDLSLDVNYPDMKNHGYMHKPEVYYQHGLNNGLRARIQEDAKRFREE